jgi:MIP family channel proteins
VSELFGTYSLVLIGPGTVIAVSLFSGLNPLSSLILIGMSFGGTVGAIVALFGKHSGAHINPAITVACTVSKTTPRGLFLPYVTSQIVGGLLAGLTLRLMFGSATSLGATQLVSFVNPLAGVVLETVGTFALVVVVLITASRVQSSKRQGLIVGTTLFILIILIGPLTGASLNPARSLGPGIASGYLANQLVYRIGPISGGLIGAFQFNIIQGHARAKDTKYSLCVC